jgi:hypothetical protein
VKSRSGRRGGNPGGGPRGAGGGAGEPADGAEDVEPARSALGRDAPLGALVGAVAARGAVGVPDARSAGGT